MNDVSTFWSNVAIGGPDDCWPWQGGVSSTGYGTVKWDIGDGRGSRTQGAHRVAYTLAHGPLRRGEVVMHACDYRPCCNPAHLSAGTTRDNALDRADKHRGRGQSRGGVRPPAGRKYW